MNAKTRAAYQVVLNAVMAESQGLGREEYHALLEELACEIESRQMALSEEFRDE